MDTTPIDIMPLVRRFRKLFNGLDRAYGTYELSGETKYEGLKKVGKAVTHKKPVTDDLVASHLKGGQGIGMVPINDDNKCFFGAIDVDSYSGLDLQAVAKQIQAMELPLVPCRSKSGGLHMFLFCKEAIPASVMRSKLTEMSASLGFAGSEIFPKQSEILTERGDIGQWINLPYFEYKNTSRHGIRAYDGGAMSLEEFLLYGENHLMSTEKLAKAGKPMAADLSDGPPCLQHLTTQGFSPGTRNDGLFSLGVYCRMAAGDLWEKELESMNVKYMDPPVSSKEVQDVIRSLNKKEYSYSCSKPPLKPHCNRDLCRSRKYGCGQASTGLSLTGMTKYDTVPPVWFLDVDGCGRIELTTDAIHNQGLFQKRCLEVLNKFPPVVGRQEWQSTIQGLLDAVTVIEAPEDSTPVGQLKEHLERFCTGRAQAKSKDEILMGKPWTDGGRTFFRLSDLMTYLERQHFREFRVHAVSSVLKEMGGNHASTKLKGKGVSLWDVPAFESMSGSFDLPDMGTSVI